MLVALHDADKTRFPNLALMKLSGWHKSHGDTVVWFSHMKRASYDLVYSSRVFSWTAEEESLPGNTIRGGTGYGLLHELDAEIEHSRPDYSLYPDFTSSLGFTTRGCIRSCPWCIVPKKEGSIRPHASILEFLRPDSREVTLLDNNILASDWGLSQLIKVIDMRLKLDCNQGLDARIIANTPAIAQLLAEISWPRGIRLACDDKSQMEPVEKAVQSIRKYSGKKGRFSCYVLVKNVEDALERVTFLRQLDVDPFAQPYREPGSKCEPEKILKHFARWVNRKWIFKACSWEEYIFNKMNKI
ncbi:MAG: hypothetical protein K1W05_09970 [Desulfovibrio sp.]|jgi:hypothetical protein